MHTEVQRFNIRVAFTEEVIANQDTSLDILEANVLEICLQRCTGFSAIDRPTSDYVWLCSEPVSTLGLV